MDAAIDAVIMEPFDMEVWVESCGSLKLESFTGRSPHLTDYACINIYNYIYIHYIIIYFCTCSNILVCLWRWNAVEVLVLSATQLAFGPSFARLYSLLHID